jgi:hypothetical protein
LTMATTSPNMLMLLLLKQIRIFLFAHRRRVENGVPLGYHLSSPIFINRIPLEKPQNANAVEKNPEKHIIHHQMMMLDLVNKVKPLKPWCTSPGSTWQR